RIAEEDQIEPTTEESHHEENKPLHRCEGAKHIESDHSREKKVEAQQCPERHDLLRVAFEPEPPCRAGWRPSRGEVGGAGAEEHLRVTRALEGARDASLLSVAHALGTAW